MDRLITMSEAKRRLGVCTKTIQRMDHQGRIRCVRTAGGRRRIPESEIIRVLGELDIRNPVGYVRVSSQGQKTDLNRQIQVIRMKYPGIEIFSDIRSGLKFEARRGFIDLLNTIRNRCVSKVVVVHEDRLSRFGYDLIREVFNGYGTEIEVLMPDDKSNPQEELAKDLITIITSFSSRLYGLRSHQSKRLIKTAREVIKSEPSL